MALATRQKIATPDRISGRKEGVMYMLSAALQLAAKHYQQTSVHFKATHNGESLRCWVRAERLINPE